MKPIEFFSNMKRIDAEKKKEGVINVEQGGEDTPPDDYYRLLTYERYTRDYHPCVLCHDVFKVDKPIRIVKDEHGYHTLLNTSTGKYIHCSFSRGTRGDCHLFTFINSNRTYPRTGYYNSPPDFKSKKEFIEYAEKLNSKTMLTSDELNDVFLNAYSFNLDVTFPDNKIKLSGGKVKDTRMNLKKHLNESTTSDPEKEWRFPKNVVTREDRINFIFNYSTDKSRISKIIPKLSDSAKIFIKFTLNEGQVLPGFRWSKLTKRYAGYDINKPQKELYELGLCHKGNYRYNEKHKYWEYDLIIPDEVKSILGEFSDEFTGFEGKDSYFYVQYAKELSKREIIRYATLINVNENSKSALEHDVKVYLDYIASRTIRTSAIHCTMPISRIKKINDTFKVKENPEGIKTEERTRRFFFIDYFSRKLDLVDAVGDRDEDIIDFEDKMKVINNGFGADDFFDAWLNDIIYNELFFIPDVYIHENFGIRDNDKKADPFMFLSKRRKAVIDAVNKLNHEWIPIEEFLKKLKEDKGFFIREEMGWEVWDIGDKKWLIDQYEWEKVEGKYALIILEIMNYFGLVSFRYENNKMNVKNMVE